MIQFKSFIVSLAYISFKYLLCFSGILILLENYKFAANKINYKMSQNLGVFKKKSSQAVGRSNQDREIKSGMPKIIQKADPQKQILKIADKLKVEILKTSYCTYLINK